MLFRSVVIGAIPRISQPWFIQKLALDLLGPSEATLTAEKVDVVPIAADVNPNAAHDAAAT